MLEGAGIPKFQKHKVDGIKKKTPEWYMEGWTEGGREWGRKEERKEGGGYKNKKL